MEFIKDKLYKFLVDSGIVWRLMPVIKHYITWFGFRKSNINYLIKDDKGCILNTTKIGDTLYPPFGLENFTKCKDLKIKHNEVLICGFPKTGCHWTFEIVRMLLNRSTVYSKYGKDFEGFLEFLPEFVLDSLPSPRILNTHLLYDDLPVEIKTKKTKIILTTRCPKDVVVSYYNHVIKLHEIYGYRGTFDDFFKLFMQGELGYSSYFDSISDWNKVMASPTTPNPIYLLRFEDLKSNSVEMIKKLATFLDVDVSDTFVEEVARCTQFKKLKTAAERESSFVSALYRKGIVGDWKNWLSEEQSAEIDARMKALMG